MKDPEKHLQVNEAKWDKWADSLDGNGRRYRFLRSTQSSLIALLEIKEGVTFLDVGCGTGWAVGQVAKLVNGNGLFYGVDLSKKMIEKAKENFNGRNNFHFIKSDVESIPLGDKIFDIVICTNSFHHYLNPDKALKEFCRLLKEGGKFYLLDPTADTWLIKCADKILKLIEPEHVKLYSTTEFQRMFADAGLEYLRTKPIDSREKVHIGRK